MAVAKTKRVTRRDWTRDEVKELKKHLKGKTQVKTISRNTQAHARGLKTKGFCARNLAGPPQQKEVSGATLSEVREPGSRGVKLQSPSGSI